MIPRIKICCIQSFQDAKLAVKYGASAIGLVSHMPSGPGIISEQEIAAIAFTVPPPIATVLLTSLQDAEEIIEQHKYCKTSAIQLCDKLTGGTIKAIAGALPGIKLIQVIHVSGEKSVREAIDISPFVDAVLLDSGTPNAADKRLGGTGKIHNWAISKKICRILQRPVFLAGGLNPDNVKQAVDYVQPFGVDVCTGVRENGTLDEIKLQKFTRAALNGDLP